MKPVLNSKKQNTNTTSLFKTNKEILSKEVRIDGQILLKEDALKKAEDLGVDLIEINAKVAPSICVLMDYGKFLYENKKKEQENLKKQRLSQSQLKEIKLKPVIEENDLKVKIKSCEKFLTNGDKVKIQMIFKGREIANQKNGLDILEKLIQSLSEISQIEGNEKNQYEAIKKMIENKGTCNNKLIMFTLTPLKTK